jgi:hypothetical protein
MAVLNRSTQRRLQELPQIPSVWEGDRRPLLGLAESSHLDAEPNAECIIWVDGVEGVVRAMEVVAPDVGQEATVRALLRAMEHPHTSARPARPHKIVVRDRELQFFLRGVLQDLEIIVDYAPELPLINELFRGFQELASNRPPKLPPQYANVLLTKAYEMWQEAPWELLADHQIISIELNQWDVGTLYASVMGMLGMEYGILFYRSLESLKRFRASVLLKDSFEQMEEAFLGQDCLFLTFEHDEDVDEDDEEIDLADLSESEIQPNFGTIHPFEGMRPFLYEEEAIAIYVAIEALHRFLKASHRQLAAKQFPTLTKRYRIPLPQEMASKQTIPVKVATVPDVTAELFEMVELAEENDFDSEDMSPPLRDDLVPKDSFLSLGMMPWEHVELLRSGFVEFHQPQEISTAGEGLPIILIQTTRPKAKVMVEQIKEAGGLKGICFNPGQDPLAGDRYDLGVLQTEDENLYLFGEFEADDPVHITARKKWDQRCKKTKGYCGLIIAKGLTGASRGNPQLRDMVALFETRSLSSKDIGLGVLQLIPQLDF